MKRKYIVACTLGLMTGAVLVIWAGTTNFCTKDWLIPCWDDSKQHLIPQMWPLHTAAILLRSLKILIDGGFSYLIIPAFIAGLLTKLNETAKKSINLSCFLQSGIITICAMCFFSLLLGMATGIRECQSHYLGYRFWNVFQYSIVMLVGAWASLIAPSFWLLVFACLRDRARHKMKFSVRNQSIAACVREFSNEVRDLLIDKGYRCGTLIQSGQTSGFYVREQGLDIWIGAGLVDDQLDHSKWGIAVLHDAHHKPAQWFKKQEAKLATSKILSDISLQFSPSPSAS